MTKDGLDDIHRFFELLTLVTNITKRVFKEAKYLYLYDEDLSDLNLTETRKIVTEINVKMIQCKVGSRQKHPNFWLNLVQHITQDNYRNMETLKGLVQKSVPDSVCTLMDMARFLLNHDRVLDVQICSNESDLILNLEHDRSFLTSFNVYIVCLDPKQSRWLTLVYARELKKIELPPNQDLVMLE
jgi:hypothetical protein